MRISCQADAHNASSTTNDPPPPSWLFAA
jgi:hypothetical protein